MPRDVQNMSLLHRKQGHNETVEDYSYALSVLFSRSTYPEQVQIDLFMAGLKEEYREAVILARPNTLIEAENLAILKEACQQKDSTLPNATMVAQLFQDSKSQQGELYELKRELRSLKYIKSIKKNLKKNDACSEILITMSATNAVQPPSIYGYYNSSPLFPDLLFATTKPLSYPKQSQPLVGSECCWITIPGRQILMDSRHTTMLPTRPKCIYQRYN